MNFIYNHLKPIALLLIFSLFVLIFFEPIALLAQGLGKEYLQSGIQKYNHFDINGAIVDLEKALSEGLKNTNDKIEACKYLAFCYAEKENFRESVIFFKDLLKIKHDFDLGPDPSPTHLKPFEQAKREMKGSKKTWFLIAGIVIATGTILFFLIKKDGPKGDEKLIDPPVMPGSGFMNG